MKLKTHFSFKKYFTEIKDKDAFIHYKSIVFTEFNLSLIKV